LWNQDLLEAMIEFLAGPKCVFASYASRTVLKKALKKFGFKLEKRAGFAGKREATFAVRNTHR
jgi:tRNA U34 5-methylaminomethyl-2-thiouridine-forming methyltransferase MnmC